MGAKDARFEGGVRRSTLEPRLVEGVLANLRLMDGVDPYVVRELAAQSTLVHAKRGEIVVSRNEPVPGLFAIAYGSVKGRLRHPGGGEVVLALLGPGDTFAEVPALLARPAKLDAVALADSMLLVINSACISAQAHCDPRLARNVANTLAQKMQALVSQLERRMLPSLQRVATYLDSIAEPGEVPGTWIARLPVSKTLTAARLDIKKETLSRLLRTLSARGLISLAGREICILDRAALSAVTR